MRQKRKNHIIQYALFTLLGGFAAGNLAQALEGYYTEEEVRTYNTSSERNRDNAYTRKSWYAGDRMRKEEPWPGITIARFDLEAIYVLSQQWKTYNEFKTDDLAQTSAEMLQTLGFKDQNGKVTYPEDLYLRTEATKMIGAWQCYQVITNPKYRRPETPYAIFWYCKDVGFPSSVYIEQLRQLFGNSPETNGLFDRLLKFEGYPVRTETHGPGDSNIITSLIKIEKRKNIDPALFEIPSGYKLESEQSGPGPIRNP
ncbi:MAG: hypothetical protein NTW14_04070 [bacterium]|nr:hypothetical protein [bacterium]